MIEMEVIAVQPEPNSNHPLVWLKDKAQRIFLPIAIGNFEATAIFMELYNDPPPRPIAYDLLRSILDGFDVQVEQVVICALKDETFYAEIVLKQNGRQLRIDSRPSDAIALALRIQVPIFVDEDVVAEAGLPIEIQEEQDIIGSEEVIDSGDLVVGGVEQRVIELRAKLQEVVAREEYEEAAKLRDEIGRLEHEIQNR